MEMEIDTGASLSVMSEQEFRNLWPKHPLVASDVTLHSYSGECIPVVGSVDVSVQYKGKLQTLPLVIVKGVSPSLVGRNWLRNVQFDWQEIFWSRNTALAGLLGKYSSVFSEGLGTVKGFKAKIHVDAKTPDKIFKSQKCAIFLSRES